MSVFTIHGANEGNIPLPLKRPELPSQTPWPRKTLVPVVQKMLDTFVVLPAFNILATVFAPGFPGWFTSSYCVQQYNYSAPGNFSFKDWQSINLYQPSNPVDNVSNYLLVVKFIKAGVVTRYTLWDKFLIFDGTTGDEYSHHIPPYAGQVIPPNFSFEVWCLPKQFAVLNDVPINILTSFLRFPQNSDSLQGFNDLSPHQLVPISSSIGANDAGFIFAMNNTPIVWSPNIPFLSN